MVLATSSRSPVRSVLAPFVAMPFAPSSFLLLVVRPGAPSSVLARVLPTSSGFCPPVLFFCSNTTTSGCLVGAHDRQISHANLLDVALLEDAPERRNRGERNRLSWLRDPESLTLPWKFLCSSPPTGFQGPWDRLPRCNWRD